MQLNRLGPYDLDEPLGKGGMGTVYRAFHGDTGEGVAVKALAPGLAATEGFRDRFEAEIESLKLLRHPGIVRLLAYGEEDGLLYYAMELIDGTSLEEEIRAGRRFTWREVTDYSIQICRALKHAHDHGVIHRDIKPANLLLDREGRIRIADFGIARLFGSTQLTSAGGVLGTADYMPPEQIDGRNVTDRCDQYSLGGVMYALLAGRPPFRAKTLPEMLQLQRFAEPEPVRRYAPDTPEQLERVVMQLLSKDAADRFPNTLVLARHMEAMRRALSRPAPDDFALSGEAREPAGESDGSYEAVGMNTTRIEPGMLDEPKASVGGPDSLPSPSPGTAKATVRGTELTAQMANPAAGGQAKEQELEVEAPIQRSGHATGLDGRRAVAPSANRFRTVDEDLLESRETDRTPRLLFVAQVAGLAGAIVLVGVFIWYLARPTTADDLYAQIDEQATEGRAEALRTVESEIEEFLERFPRDPRTQEVEGYLEEIELSRLEADIHRRARRRFGGQSLAPIEQLYLDAVRKADSDPDEAIRNLHSILVLYQHDDQEADADVANPVRPAEPAGSSAAPPPTSDNAQGSDVQDDSPETQHQENTDATELNRRVKHCLLLVQHRLSQLTEYTESEAKNQLPVLRRRLDRAHALRTTDPYGARRIYLAVIDLCRDKQWARGIVEEAEAALMSDGSSGVRQGGQKSDTETEVSELGRLNQDYDGP